MKKSNNKGFVLAETVVVTVFMVTIFAILYSSYFPIIGHYEKREFYDDVDSKYIAYWLKYMIQDKSYVLPDSISSNDYVFFDCNNIKRTDDSSNIIPEGLSKYNSCTKFIEYSGLLNNPYRGGSKSTGGNEAGTSCSNPTDTYCSNNGTCLSYVAIITNYSIKSFKESINGNNLGKCLSDGFIDYINSLPDYSVNKTKENDDSNGVGNAKYYRILVEIYDDSPVEKATTDSDKSISDNLINNNPNYKYASFEVRKVN